MMKTEMKQWILFFLMIFSSSFIFARTYEITSPNSKIKTLIHVGDDLTYDILYEQTDIIKKSKAGITIDGVDLGQNLKVKKVKKNSVDEMLIPVVKQKNKEIRNHYNEIVLEFTNKMAIEFRAFNEGVAYRFRTNIKNDIVVNGEEVLFSFAGTNKIYFPEEESFNSHNERLYLHEPLKDISKDRLASLPALVENSSGIKIGITETDLLDYAGLWIKGTGSENIEGTFPGVALETDQKNDRDVHVTKWAGYIAETKGTRSFPWRIIAIAGNDADLITNEMVFLLSEPCKIEDPSWIKPGKVAWDWWNYNNVYEVDFRAGVNTETYKYYIDFASKYGIEYIILDEGWYVLGDLMNIVPEIDMEEILSYAEEKNVGVILWVIWKTLDDQLQVAMDQFEEWGVKGIKVDFMQRDDQWMVNYYYRIAEEAAKRKLLVDYHGSYKPAGLHRTFPNVISREGVKGMENCKWTDEVDPEHNVTIPFIRMFAGPMDYTPGAMVNANKENFRDIFNRPMSSGTRCHQLAMYVVYESPLQMLSDNPTNYYHEPECMKFLSAVPSVWDKTVVLDARVGDYVSIARKSGDDWYVGAMTDWSERNLQIDFSFLEEGEYKMDIYQDGINADRYASDFVHKTISITNNDKLDIHLAPGGGWTARIYK